MRDRRGKLPDRCKENTMSNDSSMHNEGSSFLTGIKTVALIVILGAIAAVADHAFFVAPYETEQHATDAAPAAMAPASPDAFAVPENLRTNARDVPEHVTAF
jgi:hypothetical protein